MLNRKTNLVEDMIICNDPLGTSKQQMLTVVIPYSIPYLFIIPQFNLHDNRNSLRMQKRFLETFQLFKLFTGGKSITNGGHLKIAYGRERKTKRKETFKYTHPCE